MVLSGRYLSSPFASEGLSNSLVEAMTSGLSIVSAYVSGSIDILAETDAGELVEMGDVRAWAEAINRFLRGPARCAACGTRARQHAEARLPILHVAIETVALYERLFSEKGASI